MHKLHAIDMPILPYKRNDLVQGDNSPIDYGETDAIKDCRKIRQLADSKHIKIDQTLLNENFGHNIDFFMLIEATGVDLDDYITSCLRCVQPYSLQGFSQTPTNQIWLIDIGHNISMILKVDGNDTNSPIVVSFRESDKSGTSKNISDTDLCAVFVDSASKVSEKMYRVTYTVQRGFIRYSNIISITEYCQNDIAYVPYMDINNNVESTLNNILTKIQENYLDDKSIPTITTSGYATFLSYGYHTVDNLSLIIDLYSKYTDTHSRSTMVDICIGILSEMSVAMCNDIKTKLKAKYSNNKLVDAL